MATKTKSPRKISDRKRVGQATLRKGKQLERTRPLTHASDDWQT